MAIIRNIPEYKAPYEVMLNLYPDQFIDEGKYYSEALQKNIVLNDHRQIQDDYGNVIPMPKQNVKEDTKSSPVWQKINMDYFYTVGLAQYNYQRKRIVRNYELLKNILTSEDFYQEGPVMSMMDQLIQDADLPAYVQCYQIMTPPINDLVGEKSKRPDISRPKCVDSLSQSEEEKYYTDVKNRLVYQQASSIIKKKLLAQGVDTSNVEEFNKQAEELTQDYIKEAMSSYSSEAEKWAANMLTALKTEFNLKEIFEEGFRDMLICNRQFYHIYENKTKTGFTVDCLNPKYTWWLTTPDKKYTRDAYAAGIIEIMELSEILDKFDLPENEIDHLRKYAMMAFFPYSRESNLFSPNNGGKGIDSIKYNAYDPLILEERTKMEAMIQSENQQSLDGFLGNAAPSVGTFGNRFVVTTSYWKSKRKQGLLTYIDKNGIEQSDIVDDNYKPGTHPREISIEWGWVNQWYKGVKIGDDIYHVSPLEILDYCPIIGVLHEIKNTISVSLVDLMKPWQTIYNVCMNQVYRYLEKEKGKVLVFNKRFIPLLKGIDYKDSEAVWLRKMEEEGICFIDDSPENTNGGSSFNQFTVQDMSMSDVISARMNLALMCRAECWKLVGLSEQRLGQVQASETATGTNTAMTQSYAQTEPYFVQQEYVENQALQAIIDVAQYLECKKPESTISYIDSTGGNMFCQIQTQEQLKNRDIKLFITSRAEDQRFYNKLDELTQGMLQNGTSSYDVASLYLQNSIRQKLDGLKKIKEENEKLVQQKQQGEQQAAQAQQQKDQADVAFREKEHQDNVQLKMYEIDTKANVAMTIERIKEAIQISKENLSSSAPDMLDILGHNLKEQEAIRKRDLDSINLEIQKKKLEQQDNKDNFERQQKERKLNLEEKNIESRNQIEKEKLKIAKSKPNNKN